MFNYSQVNNFEFNECTSRGACSIPPSVSAIKEIMMLLISQIAYYLSKVETENPYFTIELIKDMANIDAVNEFSEDQVLILFADKYKKMNYLKTLYSKSVANPRNLKDILDINENMTISQIISKGQNLLLKKQKNILSKNKYIQEIYVNVLKCVCINYLALVDYGIDDEPLKKYILNSLKKINRSNLNYSNIKKDLTKLASKNIYMLRVLYKYMVKNFGEVSKVKVSASTKQNKAILVSGDDLLQLKNLLDAVEDTDIDVYSNGNLLVAHALNKFREYKNFKAHFGNSTESTMLDIATFPGPILLTKNEFQNIDYLYRGMLFSSEKFLPKGLKKTTENYSEIIDAAKLSKGFAKSQFRDEIEVGYDWNIFNRRIDVLKEKFDNGKIRKILFIGFGTKSLEQQDYFQKLFNLLPEDVFVFSLSHFKTSKNILHINVSNNYPLLLHIVEQLFTKIPIKSERLTFFLMKCDAHSISKMISLKDLGVKNIYLSKCPPTSINPSVLKLFKNEFDIKDTTVASEDLKNILT